MTKMAPMQIGNKTLKYLVLQNHCADCLETRYVASETLGLQVHINDDHGLTLLFYGKVKFCPISL